MWYLKFIGILIVGALLGLLLLMAWPTLSERANGTSFYVSPIEHVN